MNPKEALQSDPGDDAPAPARRIVSLAPAITEILFALGAGDRVVGVTDSCDYPPEVAAKPHVRCWFEPDLDILASLRPDLVLGLESAHRSLKTALTGQPARLILVNPVTVDETLALIQRLGRLVGTASAACTLVNALSLRLERLDQAVARIPMPKRPTVCRVLDWEADQFYVAGPRSFQYDGIRRSGGRNIDTGMDAAYPRIDHHRLKALDPEIIFICGSDRNLIARLKKDPRWQPLGAVQSDRIYQFPCDLTCRSGPRIVDMAEALFTTLYAKTPT